MKIDRTLLRVSFVMQIVGMMFGVYLLLNSNPHATALFFFLGAPLIGLGVIGYVITVIRDLKRSNVI